MHSGRNPTAFPVMWDCEQGDNSNRQVWSGFAYVEFVEVDAVQNALLLNESELHGRQLKVFI